MDTFLCYFCSTIMQHLVKFIEWWIDTSDLRVVTLSVGKTWICPITTNFLWCLTLSIHNIFSWLSDKIKWIIPKPCKSIINVIQLNFFRLIILLTLSSWIHYCSKLYVWTFGPVTFWPRGW